MTICLSLLCIQESQGNPLSQGGFGARGDSVPGKQFSPTEAYLLRYVARSGSQDTLMYKPPLAARIRVKREDGPAKEVLRRGKDNFDSTVLRFSKATVFTNRAN